MARGTSQGGLIGAIRYDIQQLHIGWMALFFPRQRQQSHSVLGKWTPQSTTGKAAYRGWSTVGALVVALLYPFVLFGFAARYYTSRIDRTAASLGILGVILLSVVVWGSLAALARMRFSTEGFLAVTAAEGVATIAAALAYLTSKYGGRITTVLFAYPFGMTALFLPPVVAALYSPSSRTSSSRTARRSRCGCSTTCSPTAESTSTSGRSSTSKDSPTSACGSVSRFRSVGSSGS